MRDALLNWPARVSGLIAAELGVDPHLLRHSFELTSIHGHPIAGVIKDVVLVPPFQTTEVDFTAAQPGRAVFCCHMQQHMDFGFMAVFDTV